MKQYPDFPYVRDEMLTKIIGCAINGEAIRSDLIENMVAEIRELRAGADRAAQLEAEVARLRVNDARYRALRVQAYNMTAAKLGLPMSQEWMDNYDRIVDALADAMLNAGHNAAAQPQGGE